MINCKECIHYKPCKAWASGDILCDITPDAFCDYFKEKTTVDAEHVRHGRWVRKGQDIYCSECGGESKYTWHGSSAFSNYCPNCGAKMVGKAGEQE